MIGGADSQAQHFGEQGGLAPYVRHVRLIDGEWRYVRFGVGPTVVLLHPLRMQLEYWLPLFRWLPGRLDVIAPDLPGHGESDAPRVEYSAPYFIDTTAQFLHLCQVERAVVVGESIGGAIALGLAAHHHPRVARIIAINPYDYGRGGGIRRSSALASVLFAALGRRVIGSVVVRLGTKYVLRWVLEGGLRDAHNLPRELLDALWKSESRPGHRRAFVSLCRAWRSWIAARSAYPSVSVPTTLVYADEDWSRPAERAANARAVPKATMRTLAECGHFAALERPRAIADIVYEQASHFT